MPRRSDINSDSFTIEIFKGAACSQSFQYANSDGTPINITGFVFVLVLIDVFDSTFRLSTADAHTTLDSYIEITNSAQGRFSFVISDEETENANLGSGRWALQVDTGDGQLNILYRDAVLVSEI